MAKLLYCSKLKETRPQAGITEQ